MHHGKKVVTQEGVLMMEWLKTMLTEEELKELAVKKLDMKIMILEQKVEYYKWIHDKLKNRSLIKEEGVVEEEENDTEIFKTGEEEEMERAPADLLKKERPDLLKKEYGNNVIVNPPTASGKKLKGKKKNQTPKP